MENLRRKLGASGRLEAVMVAVRLEHNPITVGRPVRVLMINRSVFSSKPNP